jgi:hypothetical protein
MTPMDWLNPSYHWVKPMGKGRLYDGLSQWVGDVYMMG